MKFISSSKQKKIICFTLVWSFWLAMLSPIQAQINGDTKQLKKSQPIVSDDDVKPGLTETHRVGQNFRVEKFRIAGGSEIITIFADLNDGENGGLQNFQDVPLVSVLRDTLGDDIPENDRLRYVWMLTYTKPSIGQRMASGIPFYYGRANNKGKVGNDAPPAVLDINPSDKNMWDKLFWLTFKGLILSQFDTVAQATTLQFRDNRVNYKKSAMMRALGVLSLYEELEGEKILSDTEMQDIQARTVLKDNLIGSFMQSENLSRVYKKNIAATQNYRAQNWELLRQYSEAQGLYFDPLKMPDGSATHAMVWVAENDLAANANRKFESRFLNIKNPWKDSRLRKWKGYKETRFYDEESREVAPETPNAKAKTLIPLALYSLDYPKIPAILVDFRDSRNPKMREISKRVLDDVTRNVLSISKFGSIPYFFGRFFYDFFTARRGIDLNQASRFKAYSQLKLLLLLDQSLNEDFRDQIADRLEKVSTNPLENDVDVEVRVARKQYENLMAYAKRPDGLAKKIEQDRREEMVRLKHSPKQRMLYAAAHLFSFGLYTHRENSTPELLAEMDLRRQLDFHERILIETARDSARPEIDGDFEAVKKALAFVAEHGEASKGKTAKAVSKIFLMAEDEGTRMLALSGLNKMNAPAAKKELLALYENQKLETEWRNVCAEYLELSPIADERQLSSTGIK